MNRSAQIAAAITIMLILVILALAAYGYMSGAWDVNQ